VEKREEKGHGEEGVTTHHQWASVIHSGTPAGDGENNGEGGEVTGVNGGPARDGERDEAAAGSSGCFAGGCAMMESVRERHNGEEGRVMQRFW
ncbi:hypothetical protein HAX54_029402, partial [Datura stramonium]|nr:hypothetical protein [Datura stramonium]